MFINELKLYVDYLEKQLKEAASSLNEKQRKYFQKFRTNLLAGIAFYKNALVSVSNSNKILEELGYFERELLAIGM
jgi:hypothetical protein